MRHLKLLAVACTTYAFVILLFHAASPWAAYQSRSLNQFASVFAMRPVVARCMAEDEDRSPMSYGAWGYVKRPIGRQRAEQIHAPLCEAALHVNDSSVNPYMRAVGVMVLVHEAYHLRHWHGASDEGRVQCQAIRHWKVAARLMGASEETIAELWPWALAAHYEEANLVDWFGNFPYRYDACQVPWLEPDLP